MLKKKQIEATATWLIKIAITSSWKFWLFISLKRAAAVFGLLSWCSVPVILNELKKKSERGQSIYQYFDFRSLLSVALALKLFSPNFLLSAKNILSLNSVVFM